MMRRVGRQEEIGKNAEAKQEEVGLSQDIHRKDEQDIVRMCTALTCFDTSRGWERKL